MTEADHGTPEPKDSPAYRMAYVLHHWPRPLIQRVTLRSLLPVGTTVRIPDTTIARRKAKGYDARKSRNRVTGKFKQKLSDWEEEGRIRREGDWVRILDRDAFAEGADRLRIDRALWLADILANYRQEPPAPDPELRRRELLTLQALMEGRDLHSASGRGSVRLLPRGRTL